MSRVRVSDFTRATRGRDEEESIHSTVERTKIIWLVRDRERDTEREREYMQTMNHK